MNEAAAYFTTVTLVHGLILFILLIPSILFIVLAAIKKKKLFVFTAIIFLGLPIFVYNQQSFTGYQITKECYIKKHFFQDKYYLSDKKGKCLADNICEWCITEDFIYGFCYNDSDTDTGFIYNRNTKETEMLFQEDFETRCNEYGLERPTRVDSPMILRDGLPRVYPLEKQLEVRH